MKNKRGSVRVYIERVTNSRLGLIDSYELIKYKGENIVKKMKIISVIFFPHSNLEILSVISRLLTIDEYIRNFFLDVYEF